jgi:Tol biopolymer transport system component
MGTDFPNYYTAAVLTLKHQPLRQFYDWVWFQRQIHYAGIDHQLGGYIPHTPLTMLPFVPLTSFPPQRAKQVWLTLELLMLAAIVLLLAKLSRLAMLEVSLLALLSYGALSNNFLLGQYYILILFLLTCGLYCLLRDREYIGGGLLALIFALKLYTGPFAIYFVARRQWKALSAFIGAVAGLALLAIALFGWDSVWFFATTVMMRGIDGSVNDPYNPGWLSMTAFLRRTFLAEAELNPHPTWPAPAAFFFLRSFYTLGALAFTLVALSKSRRVNEAHALAWFVVLLFVLSPNQASYHFVLLLVPIALLLAGASKAWSAGLIALYVLVELPLFQWDAWLFPKAWLMLALFLYVGWPFLKDLGSRTALATLFAVVIISMTATFPQLRNYRMQPPQTTGHAIVQPAAIYSSAPVRGADGWLYCAIGGEQYVVRGWNPDGIIQTFEFDGDAFHPAAPRARGSFAFELVAGGASKIYRFDAATKALTQQIGNGLNPTEPALSPDGTKLAFVAQDSLYVAEGDKPSILTTGAISNPTFFPNGNQIAFAKGLPGRRSIIALTISSREARTLVDRGDCFEPATSPDGRLLAFACSETGARHIWVEDLASAVSRRLTNGLCNNDSPAWAEDSQSIVFASDCGRGLGLPALYRTSVR